MNEEQNRTTWFNASGQSYKACTRVNYDSGVVNLRNSLVIKNTYEHKMFMNGHRVCRAIRQLFESCFVFLLFIFATFYLLSRSVVSTSMKG